MTTPLQLPPEARELKDIRTCDARAEIDRCLRILTWVDRLPVAELVRAAPPRAGAELISVVVPMHNARPWIDACIKGLLAQTHANLEIFCVDDASDDDSYARVVEQFGADRRICAIRLGTRVGPYQIKNWVIGSLARGAYVALQDADDVSHPLRIATQWRWMRDAGVRVSGTCAHHFFLPDDELGRGTGPPVEVDGMRHNLAFYPTIDAALESPLLAASFPERAGAEFWNVCRVGPYKLYWSVLAGHGTQMVERALFLELGGFDGRTRIAADSDFNERLVRFYPLGNVPQVLYSRRFHALSLIQHPATNFTSTARLEYRARRDVRTAAIREAAIAGDVARTRELCTEDLYCGDIMVEHMHCGFDVALS